MTGITRPQKAMGGLMAYRMIGAALFDAGTYEGVEADRSATRQAIGVVLLSALAAGVGASGWEGPTVATVARIAALAVVTWVAWAVLMFQIGTRVLPGPGTRTSMAEMLRTLGFAASPGILMAFAALPRVTLAIFAVAWVWMFAATVVAVQHALDYAHIGRALAVSILAAVLVLTLAVALGLIFGPALS